MNPRDVLQANQVDDGQRGQRKCGWTVSQYYTLKDVDTGGGEQNGIRTESGPSYVVALRPVYHRSMNTECVCVNQPTSNWFGRNTLRSLH